MLKRAATAAVCSMLLVVALAAAQTASANSGPQSTSDVVFDNGFAYWAQIGEEAVVTPANNSGESDSKPPRVIASIVEQNLATGVRRTVFGTVSNYKLWLGDLHANAGRIAFTSKNYAHPTPSKPYKMETTKAYAMGVNDALPMLLESQTKVYRGHFKTKKHKGKKYKEFNVTSDCGVEVRTQDVSELGETLVSRSTVGCTKQRKKKSGKKASVANGDGIYYKNKAYKYAAGSKDEVAIGNAPWGPMLLRANELIGSGDDNAVVARDLASGTLRPYADQPQPSEIVSSPDRRLAIVANEWTGKKSPSVQKLSVFPPAANAPAVAIPVPTGESTAVAFCADHFVQVSGPSTKDGYQQPWPVAAPYRVTLRDYAGAVVTEVVSTATGQFAGVGCNGRVAQVATNTELGVVITPVVL